MTPEQLCALLLELLQEQDEALNNFLRLLSTYHRLLVLPEIFAHYKSLYEQTGHQITCHVSAATKLSAIEQTKLSNMLQKTFGKEPVMLVDQDKDLLAGFTVKVGDKILDASLLGQLKKLRGVLCH